MALRFMWPTSPGGIRLIVVVVLFIVLPFSLACALNIISACVGVNAVDKYHLLFLFFLVAFALIYENAFSQRRCKKLHGFYKNKNNNRLSGKI